MYTNRHIPYCHVTYNIYLVYVKRKFPAMLKGISFNRLNAAANPEPYWEAPSDFRGAFRPRLCLSCNLTVGPKGLNSCLQAHL